MTTPDALTEIKARADNLKDQFCNVSSGNDSDHGNFLIELDEALPTFFADLSRLIRAVEVMQAALAFYQATTPVCKHDDSSWCDNCPDGGKKARKTLDEADKILRGEG